MVSKRWTSSAIQYKSANALKLGIEAHSKAISSLQKVQFNLKLHSKLSVIRRSANALVICSKKKVKFFGRTFWKVKSLNRELQINVSFEKMIAFCSSTCYRKFIEQILKSWCPHSSPLFHLKLYLFAKSDNTKFCFTLSLPSKCKAFETLVNVF